MPESPVGVAGLELRVALMTMHSETGLVPADNGFWRAKYSALFVRPAIEPIACTYWDWLRHFEFGMQSETALHAASALAGHKLVYRQGPSIGRSAMGDVNFEPMEMAAQWSTKLASAAREPRLTDAFPGYAYAQTLMAHPFSDGNGRFARLMVHAALARTCNLGYPAVALAPAFYRRAGELGAACDALSRKQDWSEFNHAFFSALEGAAVLTGALFRVTR